MSKREYGEKSEQQVPTEGLRTIRIGGELVEVTKETADAYGELLRKSGANKMTMGQTIATCVIGVAILGPLAIWLYRIALGL